MDSDKYLFMKYVLYWQNCGEVMESLLQSSGEEELIFFSCLSAAVYTNVFLCRVF